MKRLKYLLFILALLALGGHFALAKYDDGLVFIFNALINKTGSAELKSAEIIKGEPSIFPAQSSDGYAIELLAIDGQTIYKTPVEVVFPFSWPTPEEGPPNSVIESYRLPLNYLAATFELTRSGKAILSTSVPQAVCQQTQKDGVCAEFCQGRGLDPDCFQCGNGFCDPNENADICSLDCPTVANQASQTPPPARPSTSPWLVIAGVLVILGVAGAVLGYVRRRARS